MTASWHNDASYLCHFASPEAKDRQRMNAREGGKEARGHGGRVQERRQPWRETANQGTPLTSVLRA